MTSLITLEHLIIKMMPFSDSLIEWCMKHPEFHSGLKLIYSERFISLGAMVTSYSPYRPNDEVIGVYTYDYKRKNPIFKQDFIVNIGKKDMQFVLYTRNKKGTMTRYVKDINDFYRTYGKGDFYVNSHHLTLNQLPKELQERGQGAINLAERIVKGGFSKPDEAN